MPDEIPARSVTYSPEVVERVVEAYGDGASLREIAKTPGLPSWATLWSWQRDHPEFADALARARQAKAVEAARRAEAALLECNPDAEPQRTASARVTLATSRSNYYRWLAGCLDRVNFGDSVSVEAKVQAAVVVAFTDPTARAVEAVARVVDVPPAPPPQPSAYDEDHPRGTPG